MVLELRGDYVCSRGQKLFRIRGPDLFFWNRRDSCEMRIPIDDLLRFLRAIESQD
jgi:hypothetical protein